MFCFYLITKYYKLQIVNVETTEDIYEPNEPGELWIKGPGIFKVKIF